MLASSTGDRQYVVERHRHVGDRDLPYGLAERLAVRPADPAVGFMNGVHKVLSGLSLADVGGIVHGTTVADNTMIEQDGANVGLLVTEGHRDEIEMRRVHKEMIWDPSYPAPPAIARRRARIAIGERMSHTGEVLRQARRALDVGEEEGDGPGRKLGHADKCRRRID